LSNRAKNNPIKGKLIVFLPTFRIFLTLISSISSRDKPTREAFVVKIFLIISALAAPGLAHADDFYCRGNTKIEFLAHDVLTVTTDGVREIFLDSGSLGTEIPGRLFGSAFGDTQFGVQFNEDGTVRVTENSRTTIYTPCPAQYRRSACHVCGDALGFLAK
jgi:hypothetical protein